MNWLKKLLFIGVSGIMLGTMLNSNTYASFFAAGEAEKVFDEKLQKGKEKLANLNRLKKIEEILTKAFDEKDENIIRFIKSIFDEQNSLTINQGEIVEKFEDIFNFPIDETSAIVKIIKNIVELPMYEDVIGDEKYKGLAVFKDDILQDSNLKIITKFMTRNDCFSQGKTIDIKGIMVHSTASPGKMADFWYLPWNRSYENGEMSREVCVHAFLDDIGVYQYLPWNHRGWHAGGLANNTHIGFEICEPEGIIYSADHSKIISIDVEKTKEYFEKAYNNAVNLCVMLCKQFNLTEKDIICHCEGYELGIASNHGDVMHWWKFYGKNMEMFREDVKKSLQNRFV